MSRVVRMPRSTAGRRRLIRSATALLLASAGTVALAGSSAAVTTGPVPLVDCITHDSVTKTDVAFFGYSNTDVPTQVAFGDTNQIVPGIQFQGQPTVFNVGAYPRVLSVRWHPAIFASIAWELNGAAAIASDTSPTCTSGVTAPASAISATSAVLNGAVVPDGTPTTSSFEYGTSPSFGHSTPAQAATGPQPSEVHATVSGLTPATTYYFRLDATTSIGTTYGAQQSFTTPASPLTIKTATLPNGRVGHAYLTHLTHSGGTGPYTWTIVRGSLPAGLVLDHTTGAVHGLPTKAGTAKLLVTLVDSAKPGVQVAVRELTITILK
jgi:hypothetical protein